MIVFNLGPISRRLQNFFRRQKWRLRPLKHAVLPARGLKRAVLQRTRTQPRIENSTLAYAATHSEISVREIFPAEKTNDSWSRPAHIFEIPNVTFWAHYGGAVVTADNALLADLSPEVWGAAQHPIFSQWRLPQPEFLDGRTGIALTPEAAGNYYHWMLDALPRLLLLKQATGNFSNYDNLLLNGVRTAYETESLAAIGLPAEKIRYVDSRHRFAIASALIPSMDHDVRTPAPWKIHLLRELIPAAKPARRFYISRHRAAVRRVVNEQELIALLRAHQFEILELEDFSWFAQAALFAEAAIVIAPHGAALANSVFCSPGVEVVEISTRAGYRDWFLQLAAAAQLNYRRVEAAAANRSSSSHYAHENDDMIVNLASIEAIL